MNWDRSNCIALARQNCAHCLGLGLRPGRAGRSTVCDCVLRAIFRACYAKFRVCASGDRRISHVSCDPNKRGSMKAIYSRKKEEYLADFCLIAGRVLGAETRAYKLVRLYFLLGADWRQCCPKLGLDRGNFFHEVYRIEAKVGKAFAETKPHALWPLDEYFGGRVKTERRAVHPLFLVETEPEPARPQRKLKFPIAKAAA